MSAPLLLRTASLAPLLDVVRAACERELARLRADELATPALQGQLIRPLLAHAGAAGAPDAQLWRAALAVQLAHEASLLHDDVIDAAVRRRGQPTVTAVRGVAAALVEGDHLLTTGYRVAASTGSLAFVTLYARAVERTVAGERLQNARRGEVLSLDEYRAVVAGKSGELIGCAFSASAVLRGDPRAAAWFETGRRVGVCYQMVDDLLDYCAGADTGKAPFTDFAQRVWTFPLAQLPGGTWPESEAALRTLLIAPDARGRTPLDRALDDLRLEFAATRAEVRTLMAQDAIVDALLEEWLVRAELAVSATTSLLRAAPAPAPGSEPVAAQPARLTLPPAAELDSFFARNSRSFSFAARFFPPRERDRVADVYAFCRVTDDLVDDDAPVAERAARLDAWTSLCERAWRDGDTGIATLDRVLRDAARAGVPFEYVRELIAGMRMDLSKDRYESLAELRVYTHRVASVVGLWLTRLWGVHDRTVLERAADLGHAMQLTNILRDVGEDLEQGRIYLPRDLMHAYQVDEDLLRRIRRGEAPVPPRYRALLEELMAVADAYYERAFAAIPSLPPHAQRAVAAAAVVYRGIHDAIRANGYDNLRQRARTSGARKVLLAVAALWRLSRLAVPRVQVGRAIGAAAVMFALAFMLAARVSAQASTLAHLSSVEGQIAAAPGDSLLRLERTRALYFVAVEHEDRLKPALASVAAVRRDYPGLAAARAPLLHAYEGALELLRAKHGTWPLMRWNAARSGLRMLDEAVTAAPRDPEVRYLRLISCYYLPGIFGRSGSVRTDFAALAELLPSVGDDYPPDFVRDVTRFVLAHARLDEGARAKLAAWQAARETAGD